MSKKYKITLVPLNRFYFGGETSFAIGKDTAEANSSYIVASNCFPQQTSLLGMMRFLILEQKGLLSRDKVPLQGKEIGQESFSVQENRQRKNYGKIERLSSCFLQISKKQEKGSLDTLLYPAPLDRSWKVNFLSPSATVFGAKVGNKLYINGKSVNELPVIGGYDPKKGNGGNWYVGKGYVLNESDIFKEDVRIGIRRDNRTGKTLDDAYYKQKFYRFAEQIAGKEVTVSFVFEVVLKESIFENNVCETIVQLGGDGSKFRLKAEFVGDVDEKDRFMVRLPDHFWGNNPSGCYSKAVLLSDAYLNRPDCLFDISETISFRSLFSKVATTTEYDKFNGENSPSKRRKYNLYRRGSVFYFKDKKQQKEFEEEILKFMEFIQIGYNNYEIIKY